MYWPLLQVAGCIGLPLSTLRISCVCTLLRRSKTCKNVYCIGSTLVQNSSTSQLCKHPCLGASVFVFSSILILQFTAQHLASRKFWYLKYTSTLQVILDFPTYKSLTSSTACNPPRSHLCLLSRDRAHSSRVAKVASTPFSFPMLESTTHARGTSPLDRRSPFTPATATSILSCEGCSRRVFSISLGETCFPETLKVS